LAQTHTGTVLP